MYLKYMVIGPSVRIKHYGYRTLQINKNLSYQKVKKTTKKIDIVL